MFDIEEQRASKFGQFRALTAEQQVMVNAFTQMVRKGQIPMTSEAPRHNEGDIPQGEGGNVDSTQLRTLATPLTMERRRRVSKLNSYIFVIQLHHHIYDNCNHLLMN